MDSWVPLSTLAYYKFNGFKYKFTNMIIISNDFVIFKYRWKEREPRIMICRVNRHVKTFD